MSWAGKVRDAIEGVVDGSDILGRLASTTQLASFRQQLADQRLDAEIANTGEPWRVPFALAAIAAPLWLADSLTLLAQSFSEAEAAAHPDHRTAMAVLTHGQLLMLLEPVELLQSEISGILADPHRRSTRTLPLLVRPYAPTEAGLRPQRMPASYVRGLLGGATSVAGSVQMLLADYGPFYQHAATPAWLARAYAATNGDLAAAQSRLDAAESRSVPLFHGQAPDEAALRELAIDLWEITNTMLKHGQLLAAPALLPGALPLHAASAAPARDQPAAATSRPPIVEPAIQPQPPPATADQPPAPAPPEPPRALPEIGPPLGSASWPAGKPPEEAPRALPQIGVAGGAPAPRSPKPAQAPDHAADMPPAPQRDAPRTMPRIGDPATSPAVPHANDTGSGASLGTLAGGPRAMPRIGDPHQPVAAPRAAMSDGRQAAAARDPQPGRPPEPNGKRIDRKERWILSGPGARHRLRSAGQEDQAERDLAAFWDAKGWSLSGQETAYLDAVSDLLAGGAVSAGGRSLAECPYAPIYSVAANSIQLLGRTLSRGTSFTYEHQPTGRGLMTDLTPQAGVADSPS